MINTLVWLARALVNDHGSSLTHTLEELVNILEPCSECDDTCRRSDIDESCCDGVSMLTRVNSLSKSLDTSGYATRCSVGLSASIVEVISKIKRVSSR